MLMVIFGAGASYDSAASFQPRSPRGADEESRPPLAEELFEQRSFFDQWVQRYPEVTPAVTRLRVHPSSTLESEMERLRVQAQREPRRAVELNAIRYYLRAVLFSCTNEWLRHTANTTNYSQLLGEIRVWKSGHSEEEVRLVSFNYDTLLEDACRNALGLEFRSPKEYTNASRAYKVYKPHGSVNWMRIVEHQSGKGQGDIDPSDVEHSIIRLGDGLKVSDEFHLIPDTGSTKLGEKYLCPAIALPVNTKVNFECPTDQIDQLKADIPAVTSLLVIGWRGTEPHFLELWKQPRFAHLRKVAIVAGGSGEALRVQHSLKGAGIGVENPLSPKPPSETRFILSDQGFSDFVTGRELDGFLTDD